MGLEEEVANGNSNHKKKRRRIWWIGTGLFVVLLIGGIVTKATSSNTKIDPTKIAMVEKGDLAKSVVATGKVQPISKVEVKSKASGLVKKLLVDAGDRVKKGLVLCELDKEEIAAQVNSSKAQLQASESNEKAAEADLERAKVDAAGPDIPMLQRAYERAKGMAKEGVVSQSALDDAQKNYELAVNKRDVART